VDSVSAGRRRLLVLGAGPGQLGVLAAAHRLELFVIAVDRDPSAPGFAYADRRAIMSVEGEHDIERLADAERIDGVIAPGIDWSGTIAARVAAKLGLPHPVSPESASLAASKFKQRMAFGEAGVPQPRYEVCSAPEEVERATKLIGFPCVLKPTDRHGRRGLRAVEGPESLDAAVADAFAAARSRVVLVEELVDGPEVTVNGFSLEGRFHPLTVTDRVQAPGAPFGVARAHVWRSGLAPEQVGEAVEAAAAAAETLGIREGPTHTQVRVAGDGPRVGELAARLGAAHDAELCEQALGIPLNDLAVAAALGEEIPGGALVPVERAGGACVRFIPAGLGELQAVEGVDEARGLEGTVDVEMYRRSGYVFRPGEDEPAGAVVAVGSSRYEALERADRAAESIRLATADAEALV
jgi:biotin carboxylase